eukprot:PITA_19490
MQATVVTKEIKVKVNGKAKILQEVEEEVAQEEEVVSGKDVEVDLIREMFNVTIVTDACTIEVWMQAMQEEMDSIKRNDTWKLTELPHDKKKIGTKSVYKTKFNNDGSVERNKARLVAKGFTQKYRIYYEETFAPIARQETIRKLISLASQKKWSRHHMDMKSAFLNGYLEEEVYVE